MAQLPSPQGGPATPTETPTPPLPSLDIRTGGRLDLESMTPDDLQAQIVARERDMKYHIQALKGELVDVVEDVNVAGRPLSDRIREKPLQALGVAGGAGALLGMTWGLIRRARRYTPPDDGLDFTRARLAFLIDEAAYRVAKGTSAEDALRESARTTPAVFMERDPQAPVPKTPTQQAFGVAFNTALGFGIKTALDMLTQKLTGQAETFEAIEEA